MQAVSDAKWYLRSSWWCMHFPNRATAPAAVPNSAGFGRIWANSGEFGQIRPNSTECAPVPDDGTPRGKWRRKWRGAAVADLRWLAMRTLRSLWFASAASHVAARRRSADTADDNPRSAGRDAPLSAREHLHDTGGGSEDDDDEANELAASSAAAARRAAAAASAAVAAVAAAPAGDGGGSGGSSGGCDSGATGAVVVQRRRPPIPTADCA